jgi:hypothetical protein
MTVDWKADPDWEWRTAAENSRGELFALWEHAVEQARADVAEVLNSGDGLGQLAKRTSSASQSTGPLASNPRYQPLTDLQLRRLLDQRSQLTGVLLGEVRQRYFEGSARPLLPG